MQALAEFAPLVAFFVTYSLRGLYAATADLMVAMLALLGFDWLRQRRIRQADRHHHFTLVCASLAQIGRFARLETWQFRMLRTCLPGPYTFLLRATRATPRRLQHERRRTIGVRIPDHPVPRLLLAELGEPLMSSTLLLAADELPLTAGREIETRLGRDIDAVLDGGDCGIEPTTVVDLSVTPPLIVRTGTGALGPITGRAV